MHILQPKIAKLNSQEVVLLTKKLNISISQLPIIKSDDSSLPEKVSKGDVIKIERNEDDKINFYFRVVI